MKRASLAALLVAVLIAGCAGPRPAVPTAAGVAPPQGWRTPTGTADRVPDDWWAGFGDPVLSRTVADALGGNVDIALAASRVAEARGQFDLADAQRRPNLAGGVGAVRQRSVSAFGTPLVQTAAQPQLSIAYDVDLFGRLASLDAAARASLLATVAGRDAVSLSVTAAAASGYIGLRTLDARLAVLRETLVARANSLHLARRRAETGYTSMLELRQAEAEYRATEQLIPAAELAISRQENGLSLLLGSNPRAIARGRELASLTLPPAPAGLPSALLRRRPDIAQAEEQVVAADRTLDAARAAFLPDFQLTASAGYVASTLLGNPIGVFAFGGNVLAPLLDGGRLRGQQRVVAARRDQAAFTYKRSVLTAVREVDDALAAVRRLDEQERALTLQRVALAQAFQLATNRYRAGYSTYLEQLDAQRGLLAADLALVQVRGDRLIAAVTVFQALGGGWDRARLSSSVTY